jgi:hypothetical protein
VATALVYEMTIASQAPDGNPIMKLLVSVIDLAATLGPRQQVRSVFVTLDASAPNQFVQQTRNAIIADAAALVPPITLNPADVIQGMFS